jgi:pyridoxamine 5'-phosphate oxidase
MLSCPPAAICRHYWEDRGVSPRRPQNPPLERELLAGDPIEQFAAWFEDAEADVALEQAMTLATTGTDGAPDARMVLLKGFGPDGFRFFTNYESRKGEQLAANPRAALVLYWRELDRQVRIRGTVERLPAQDSDDYFQARPRESRIAAAISPQSRPVEREELDRRFADLERELAGADPPRPEHWGGYLLRPAEVEFWQGRDNRMHDRFLYSRDGDGWRIERLAP